MTNPLLISFLGAPGSGKTIFARNLAEQIGAVTFNSDAMRLAMFGSLDRIEQIRRTERSRLYEDVFGAIEYSTTQVLKSNISIINNAQMTKRRDRKHLSSLAQSVGATFVLVWIQTSPDIAKRRGQERASADDSHVYTAKKMNMLVDRFERVTELPTEDEFFIEISGEVPFEQQYVQFQKGMKHA